MTDFGDIYHKVRMALNENDKDCPKKAIEHLAVGLHWLAEKLEKEAT